VAIGGLMYSIPAAPDNVRSPGLEIS